MAKKKREVYNDLYCSEKKKRDSCAKCADIRESKVMVSGRRSFA